MRPAPESYGFTSMKAFKNSHGVAGDHKPLRMMVNCSSHFSFNFV